MRVDVFFRSCAGVLAVHSDRRVAPGPKTDLILTCLNSLLVSLDRARHSRADWELSLTVVDDHSDADTLRRMRDLLVGRDQQYPREIVALDGTGNAASLLTNYESARRRSQDLIYFAEDDYLHAPTAVEEMIDAQVQVSAKLGRPCFVHPCDYPDRYDDPYPSFIFAGPGRYWRTVIHSTATILMPRVLLDEHWATFIAFANAGREPVAKEDDTVNQLYRRVPCIAPMPSLALHMQTEAQLSPYVDWRAWWAEARPRELREP